MLIDFGTTHSFIFISHAKSLNHKVGPLEGEIVISMPSGEVFVVELMCQNCEVRIENVVIQVDSILFELDGLDVILGMDFLIKYHTTLDCLNK